MSSSLTRAQSFQLVCIAVDILAALLGHVDGGISWFAASVVIGALSGGGQQNGR